MNVRRIRQILWLTTALLIAAAVVALAWGFTTPVTVAATQPTADATTLATDGSVVARPLIDAQRLEHVARLRLQRPLYDPPAVEKVSPPPPSPPKLPVRLIGVAIEPPPGRSVGLFAVGNNIEFKGAGDTMDAPGAGGSATVRSIEATSATIDFAGRTITLELESAEGKR